MDIVGVLQPLILYASKPVTSKLSKSSELNNYITIKELDEIFENKNMLKRSDFINDIQIALTALSVGATLYTNNKTHFKIIKSLLKTLNVVYV